jgi:hypothetical protein
VEVLRSEEAPRPSLDHLPEYDEEKSGQPAGAPGVDFILQSYRAHQLQQQQGEVLV